MINSPVEQRAVASDVPDGTGSSPARASARWLALAAVCIGSMMAFVNISSTIGGLAAIQAELGSSTTGIVWITSAYSLTVASFVLVAGTLGDLFGRRRVFLVGTTLFVVGSAVAMLAQGTGVLIAAQAVMGVGGALVLPSSLAVVSHAFDNPRERTEAISIWAGSSGLGLAIGPLGAGLLLEAFSWHAIYAINLALGALAIAATLRFVTESRHPGRAVDPVGVVLGTFVVGSLTYAVIEGKSHGYGSPFIVSIFAACAVVLLVFAIYESRHHDPMVDVRLFRSPSFGAVQLVAATTLFGFTGIALLATLYLQRVQGLSSLSSGVRLLVMFVPFIAVSALAGRLVHRVGFKLMLAGGLVVMGAGALLLRITVAGPEFGRVWPGLLVIGIGAGFLIAPSTAAAVISVHPRQAGMASATVNMFRQLGNVLGASILGTILTSQFESNLRDRLSALGVDGSAADAIVKGGSGHHGPAPSGEAARQISMAAGHAFTDAFHLGLLVAALVILTVAVPALLFVRKSPAH